MAEEKKYLVTGNWKGQNLEVIVFAYSDKQAKFKAGITNGVNGKELAEFMRSGKIRAVRRL